jgi:hypothetical protein
MANEPRLRAVRLYQSDRGVWRVEIERDGVTKWSSLRTRNEKKAQAEFARIKAIYESAGSWR